VELRALYSDEDSAGPETYAWDLDADGQFDDGNGSIVSPTFGSGTHTVSVRVTDSDGASTIASRTIVVGSRPPVAAFEVSDGAPQAGQPLTLTSTSSDPDGGAIASYAWDLDDDGAFDDASGATAAVTFATQGVRRVGLKVRDGGGDTGIRYSRVTVSGTWVPTPTPEPSATPVPNPGPQATPSPAPDRVAPVVTATVKAPKLATLAKSGLPVKVRCSEACTVTVVLTVDKATAKRLKLGTKLELGRATGKGGTVKIKLGAKARKAIAKQRSVKIKLTITAVDAAGNRRVTTKTLTVKR
jgi:PKD repeat protein